MRVGKYELGKTLSEGNFGKVKYTKNVESGNSFAVKIIEKNRIIDLHIADQIKREIDTLKLLKHPNVVRLHKVPLTRRQCFFLVSACSLSHFFFDHLLESEVLEVIENNRINLQVYEV